jgi:integrase
VNANASTLEQKYPHLMPPPKVKHYADGKTELLNPMYGYIDKHPLWAMLCATHEEEVDPDLKTKYACLQMQILLARRREARHKAKKKNRTITEILSTTSGDRQMRVAIELGKAVRSVSTNDFVALLKALEPSKNPPLFRNHLRTWNTSTGGKAAPIFQAIFRHVVNVRDARHNNPGNTEPRKPRRPSHPEHIEYSGDRIGLAIEGNGEDGFSSEVTFQLLKLAGEDQVRAREKWEALIGDQIAWEDLIEQVLDDDAYYHRRRYSRSIDREAAAGQGEGKANMADAESGGNAAESPVADAVDSSAQTPRTPSADRDRDAADYSRALLKALGNFIAYLNRGKQASEELTAKLPAAGMILVDATMITVDEFQQALDWFEGPNVSQSQVHLRKAARVALILAFRCGLRRAEIAYLRVSDFDRPMPNEDLETADLRLRVRPWLLRKLKTANALRDLPLGMLMPVEELREVLDWVDAVRTKGGGNALVFHKTDAKKKSDYAKPMGFDSVVEALTEAFTKNVKGRRGKGRPPIVPDWHMHQCRHAFSNILLLRLWPELHEFASQAFRYHPQTLAWIAGAGTGPEQFRMDLFGVGIRGSDLQAIALLMGHGASATSCEHYLHVLDWYTPAEVGHRARFRRRAARERNRPAFGLLIGFRSGDKDAHSIGRERQVFKSNAGQLRSAKAAGIAHEGKETIAFAEQSVGAGANDLANRRGGQRRLYFRRNAQGPANAFPGLLDCEVPQSLGTESGALRCVGDCGRAYRYRRRTKPGRKLGEVERDHRCRRRHR